MTQNELITINPGILGGKPVIKGTRISVELILKLLAEGATYQEIVQDYPDLNMEAILAAIAYARDMVALEEVGHFHPAV